MTKPMVKYAVFIDGVRVGAHSKFKDAVDDCVNRSCGEDAIYREVDGLLVKCLRRTRESLDTGFHYGSW